MFVFSLFIGPRLVMFKLENHSSHSFQMMCTVVGIKNFAVQIFSVCFMNINKKLRKQTHLYMMMEWKCPQNLLNDSYKGSGSDTHLANKCAIRKKTAF